MNFFGIHFCHEELLALLSVFPFFGFWLAKARAWWCSKKACECPSKQFESTASHDHNGR